MADQIPATMEGVKFTGEIFSPFMKKDNKLNSDTWPKMNMLSLLIAIGSIIAKF